MYSVLYIQCLVNCQSWWYLVNGYCIGQVSWHQLTQILYYASGIRSGLCWHEDNPDRCPSLFSLLDLLILMLWLNEANCFLFAFSFSFLFFTPFNLVLYFLQLPRLGLTLFDLELKRKEGKKKPPLPHHHHHYPAVFVLMTFRRSLKRVFWPADL